MWFGRRSTGRLRLRLRLGWLFIALLSPHHHHKLEARPDNPHPPSAHTLVDSKWISPTMTASLSSHPPADPATVPQINPALAPTQPSQTTHANNSTSPPRHANAHYHPTTHLHPPLRPTSTLPRSTTAAGTAPPAQPRRTGPTGPGQARNQAKEGTTTSPSPSTPVQTGRRLPRCSGRGRAPRAC